MIVSPVLSLHGQKSSRLKSVRASEASSRNRAGRFSERRCRSSRRGLIQSLGAPFAFCKCAAVARRTATRIYRTIEQWINGSHCRNSSSPFLHYPLLQCSKAQGAFPRGGSLKAGRIGREEHGRRCGGYEQPWGELGGGPLFEQCPLSPSRNGARLTKDWLRRGARLQAAGVRYWCCRDSRT